MAFKNKHDFEKYRQRRGELYAGEGLALEDQVESILETLKEEGQIASFQRHAHNSSADRAGKDFSATKEINGEEVTFSFGVTISMRSWNEARARHYGVPQFCFPIGSKPETIVKRILGLFKDYALTPSE